MRYLRLFLVTAVFFGAVACANMQTSELERAYLQAYSTDTVEALEGFLKQHPVGEFSDMARERIRHLEREKKWAELKGRLYLLEMVPPADVGREISILRTSKDPVARGYAAYDLGNKGERAKGAILALIEAFDDDVSLVWVRGAATRSRISEEELSRILGKNVVMRGGTPQNIIRTTSPAEEAVLALGVIKDPRAVEPLVAALKDVDISEAAADALGKIKDLRAVEPLIEALKDKHTGARVKAALALGSIQDHRAVEPLIEAFKDMNHNEAVAVALGELKDPRAVEPLIKALKDRDSVIRWKAAEALKAITGKEFGEDQQKWKDWWEGQKGKQ
ncbi:MAG: HEAT repeat domain-containing protein [Deltaproteobacteria bacterium]|nr:HEAT repeat domain-containing protein [Deltaproteobacteria bacterium]